MKFTLPKIYLITDVSASGLSHLEQVKKLVEGGAQFIQLREKQATAKDFYEAAREVLDFARPTGVKIIINDRIDVALAVKADGVHVGQNDIPPEMARKILGKKAIIGFSTHSVAQAVRAVRTEIDYIAIGPVFATASKENPDAVVGVNGVEKVRQAIGEFPLVAIGGINFDNAGSVFQYGADSIALISAILSGSSQIAENTRKFINAYC